MDISRNAPCPCGSGKKYKRCCLLKEEREAEEREANRALYNLAMRYSLHLQQSALSKKPHYREYKKIRKLPGEIIDSMMDCYYKGKHDPFSVTRSLVNEEGVGRVLSSCELRVMEASFDMDTSAGSQGPAELIIYKTSKNTSCLTEEFIRQKRYRKPEKIEFLQAMLDSHAGLFSITSTDRAEGYVFLRDVFTGEEIKITDTGLSLQEEPFDLLMYTRIITYRGNCFGTGLSLTFNESNPFIVDYIEREKREYSGRQEFRWLVELYNQFITGCGTRDVIVNEF